MKVFLVEGIKAIFEKHKPKYVLTAYKYNARPKKTMFPYAKDILVDSGAFTVINATANGKNVKMDWDDYAVKYANFIKESGVKNYFELDIDCVVGYEKVLQLRKVIEEIVGYQSIPVWHFNRGLKEFSKMCKDYKYVGIGINHSFQPKQLDTLKYFIDEAHRNGAKIHGLGFTRTSYLKKLNFDTVDSSTWVSGGKYGAMFRFDGESINRFQDRTKRYKDRTAIDEYNLKEWIKYQEYMDKQ